MSSIIMRPLKKVTFAENVEIHTFIDTVEDVQARANYWLYAKARFRDRVNELSQKLAVLQMRTKDTTSNDRSGKDSTSK